MCKNFFTRGSATKDFTLHKLVFHSPDEQIFVLLAGFTLFTSLFLERKLSMLKYKYTDQISIRRA